MATKVGSPRPAANGSAHSGDLNWAADGQKLEVEERKITLEAPKQPNRAKKKVEDESLLASLCTLICDNQMGISANLLLLLFLTHTFFPRARRRTSKFFHLSYYNPDSGLYGCGIDDLPFVALCIVIFTALRVAVMDYILDPLARLGGIKTKRGLIRFKEQAWLIVYCTGSWSLGMYVMYHSEFWFNLNGMWSGWPFREVNGLFKWYYLVQWAFWLQQILVVNIEEKRKDYTQMFTHHIFTSTLIFLSYGYYHMRVGTVILCIMDVVDIIFPTAKLLKYMGYSTACDIAFGVFVVTWFVTRHIFYLMVCWSIYAHAPTAMTPGCYLSDGKMIPASSTEQYNALGGNQIWSNLLKAFTDRQGPICWNPAIRYSFLGLLLALQIITLLWFAMIIKVVYKVLRGQYADDVRSDDEGDGEEIEEEEEIERTSGLNAPKTGPEWAPVEQEVGVEALSFTRKSRPGMKNYKRSQNRSSGGRASGISIPGHSDRKELLGRIGCDKHS